MYVERLLGILTLKTDVYYIHADVWTYTLQLFHF